MLLRSEQHPTVVSDSITNDTMPQILQIKDEAETPEGYITFAHFGEYIDTILKAIDTYQRPIWAKIEKNAEVMERHASNFMSKVSDTIEQSQVVKTPKNKQKTLRKPFTDIISDYCENAELCQAAATAGSFTKILNWYTALQNEFQKLVDDTFLIYSKDAREIDNHLSAIDLDDLAFPYTRFPNILEKNKLIDKDLSLLKDWADTFIKEYELALMPDQILSDKELTTEAKETLSLKKYVFEFRCEPKGISYRYIGLDNHEQTDCILWENLPEGIFKKQKEYLGNIKKFQNEILQNKNNFKNKLVKEILANDKLLSSLIETTTEKGYTRSITPAKRLETLIKSYINEFRVKNNIDERVEEIKQQAQKEEQEKFEKDKIAQQQLAKEAYEENERWRLLMEKKRKVILKPVDKPNSSKSLITTVGTFKPVEKKRDTTKTFKTEAISNSKINSEKNIHNDSVIQASGAKESKEDFLPTSSKTGKLSFAQALEEQKSLTISEVWVAIKNWKADKKKYFGLTTIRKYLFTSEVSRDTAVLLAETNPTKRGTFDDNTRYKKAMEFISKNPKKAFAIELRKVLDLKEKAMLKDTPGLDVAIKMHS